MLGNGRLSIRVVLIASFSVLTAVILAAVGGFLSGMMSHHFIDMADDYNEQLAIQAKNNLDTYFTGVNEDILRFVRDQDLFVVVSGGQNKTDYEKFIARKNVQQRITALLTTQQSIANVMLFADDGVVIKKDSGLEPRMESAFLQALLRSYHDDAYMRIQYYPVMAPNFYSDYTAKKEIPVSIVIRNVSKYDKRNYGVMLASLQTDHVDKIFSEMKSMGGFTAFIIDEANAIYYSSDFAAVGKSVQAYLEENGMTSIERGVVRDERGNVLCMANSKPLEVNRWRLVILSDMAALQSKVKQVEAIILSATAIAILLVIALSCVVAVEVTRPLVALAGEMRQVSADRLGMRMKKRPLLREIGSLYDSYNEMQRRIEALIHEVYLEQLRQKDAQYEALQSKINPHFLYNTLQSIHSLSVLERNRDVEDVTTALGDMLEYLIYEKSGQVRLEQELAYITNYVNIQKLRYNERFTLQCDIQAQSRHCVINKLLIQPIVENAINHGFGELERDGRLRVTAYVAEDVLHVIVADNGAGMNETALARLRKHVASENHESRRKSIGLSNIQERIVLKYGVRFGLVIDSREGAGTTVRLSMPAIFHLEREA